MRCVEASVEPGQKRQNDDEVSAYRKALEIPMIVLDGESMSLC